MLTPWQEADLRDRWCVELLEGTSPLAVLRRLYADLRDGFPAYDPVPTRPLALHPWTQACPVCAEPFRDRRADHPQLYCSALCRTRAAARRKWARRRRTVARGAA